MENTIPSRTHYELLAGAIIRVPIFDDDGNEIATEAHFLKENICIYVEGRDTISTERIITVQRK